MSDNVINFKIPENKAAEGQPMSFYRTILACLKSNAPELKLETAVKASHEELFDDSPYELNYALGCLFGQYDYLIMGILNKLGLAYLKSAVSFHSEIDGNRLAFSLSLNDENNDEETLIALTIFHEMKMDNKNTDLNGMVPYPVNSFKVERNHEATCKTPSPYVLENALCYMQEMNFYMNQIDLNLRTVSGGGKMAILLNLTSDSELSISLSISDKYYDVTQT